MAKMNVFIHRMEADIRLGNTMTYPTFLNEDGSLCKFDLVLANLMWNQDFEQAFTRKTFMVALFLDILLQVLWIGVGSSTCMLL